MSAQPCENCGKHHFPQATEDGCHRDLRVESLRQRLQRALDVLEQLGPHDYPTFDLWQERTQLLEAGVASQTEETK